MKKYSEIITEKLVAIDIEVKQAIKDILEKHNIEKMDFQQLYDDCIIDNYTFFDVDKNGDGEALQLDCLEKNQDGEYEYSMSTSYGTPFDTYRIDAFSSDELMYVLRTIEDYLENIEDYRKNNPDL